MSHDAGQTCRCVAEHRPQPQELQRHHVWPLSLGGPDDDANLRWLCPTCHVTVHELLRAFLAAGRVLSWGEALARWPGLNRYAHSLAVAGFVAVQASLTSRSTAAPSSG